MNRDKIRAKVAAGYAECDQLNDAGAALHRQADSCNSAQIERQLRKAAARTLRAARRREQRTLRLHVKIA